MKPKTIAAVIKYIYDMTWKVFGWSTFMMFILEEAGQACTFLLYILKGSDVDSMSRVLMLHSVDLLAVEIHKAYSILAFINPISAKFYNLFFKAMDLMLKVYHIIYK